jgi:hypothetical protein
MTHRRGHPTGGDLADQAAVGQHLPTGLVVVAGVQVRHWLGRQRAEHTVIGGPHRKAHPLGQANGDPLVAPTPQRGG